jgi:hypothetical protein
MVATAAQYNTIVIHLSDVKNNGKMSPLRRPPPHPPARLPKCMQDNITVQHGGRHHTTVLMYMIHVEEGRETVSWLTSLPPPRPRPAPPHPAPPRMQDNTTAVNHLPSVLVQKSIHM